MRVCDIVSVEDDRQICGLACMSGKVKNNFVFFAINGKTKNGNDYIFDAINSGAIVVITSDKKYKTGEKLYGKTHQNFAWVKVVDDVRKYMSIMAKSYYQVDTKNMKFVGVVGTSGKTTTTYILSHIFEFAKYYAGLIGTTGAYIGKECIYYGLTTPDPIDLFCVLKKMQDAGCKIVIMEVSVQAIELNKLYGIFFDYCIFTNITPEHMDSYKNFDEYANIKMSFFCPQNVKEAIVNVDDYYGRLIARNSGVVCITYGNNNPANIFAVDIISNKGGMSFVVNICDQIVKIDTHLVGLYNVYNIMSCMAVALGMGIKLDDIKNGIANIDCILGRYERIEVGNNKIIIDFAHTIDSIKKVIQTTRSIYNQNITVLVGCTGYSDVAKREEIGKVLDKYADSVILTSDNPQNEDVGKICQDIARFIKSDKTVIITDRVQAIQYGIQHLCGVLLLLGKGGEKVQKIGNISVPYDEKAVVLSILEGRK